MNVLIVLLIKLYRFFISPILVSIFGKACRFTPTCSQYTIEALEKFGTLKGLGLGVKRFLRCHPWGGLGYDPIPKK